MSSDQLLASAEGSAATRGVARDQVVVPLQRTHDPLGSAARLGAPRLKPAIPSAAGVRLPRAEPAHSVVAQITDYLHRPRRPSAAPGDLVADPAADPAAGAPASRPAPIAAHADELDRLLRQQIDSQLDLIAFRAPDLAQPINNVRRTVELLLRLRRP
jgi:hypothetical protein